VTIKKIKVNEWYSTTMGIGRVARVQEHSPPSVRIMIVAPIPRGEIWVRPRDVQAHIDTSAVRCPLCSALPDEDCTTVGPPPIQRVSTHIERVHAALGGAS
jgi:hypothetical protein